jgi:hypothetical protein
LIIKDILGLEISSFLIIKDILSLEMNSI